MEQEATFVPLYPDSRAELGLGCLEALVLLTLTCHLRFTAALQRTSCVLEKALSTWYLPQCLLFFRKDPVRVVLNPWAT